tara:strand:+ start:1709 stop:2626 length:918 start_codon:yes stop_codon:yes gene_type:complete
MYKINGNPEQFADLEVFHKLSKQFLPFAQKRLGFDKPVGINLLSDPNNAKNPLGKTAYYDPNKMEVTVFVDKRHVKDILRSMSHELVHHTQCCRGEFDGGVKTGAGYAQEDEHMREMERQAYEEGQMILRDFEDNFKKENKVMAEVKNKKADLNKDGKLSSYEKKRGKAIEKSMAAEGKKKKCPVCKKVKCESSCSGHGKREESLNETEIEYDGPGTTTDAPEYAPGERKPEPEKQGEEGEEDKVDDDALTLEEGEPDGDGSTDEDDDTEGVEKERGAKAPVEENWLKGNKDQLLFERLTKLWTK